MTITDRLVIWWHALRFHQSGYGNAEETIWWCQCGERRGRWRPGSV